VATIKINEERCKACELCVEFCPKHILALSHEINSRGFHPAQLSDEEQCTGCRICGMMCPDLAIEVYR